MGRLLGIFGLLAVASLPPSGGSSFGLAGQEVPVPLFTSTEPLVATLAADLAALRRDRNASPDRPGTLTLHLGGMDHAISVSVRTRGSFRLDPAHCSFPPLRIEVDPASAVGTAFEGQDDLKLVSSCRPGRSSYDDLVVKEYLVYRSLRAVSDATFQVRLLDMTFIDASGRTEPESRIAFVIEEDDALAARLGAVVFELEEGKHLPTAAFEPLSRMTTAVAQYMVGNPDWSDVAGHNVEILDRDGVAVAVPYDFDFSGLVDAPYATPPPECRLDSVRERYYRGWCENPVVTAAVLSRFRAAREEVLDAWRTERLLPDAGRARAVRYLEEFFDDIETDGRAQRRFLRDCRTPSG